MRQIVLRAAIVGLIGFAAWWDHHRVPSTPFHRETAIVLPASPEPVDDARKEKKGEGTHAAQRKAPTGQHPDYAEVDALAGKGNLARIKGTTGSPPAPESLTVGTTRAALEKKYGKPTLDVVARRNGSLEERYFYVSNDHAHITVATLHDGKVVSAAAIPR